jgi:hypothetical protein
VRTLNVDRSTNRDIADAFHFAEDQAVDGAVADYWLAYIVDARWREQLIVKPAYTDRYPPYSQRIAASLGPGSRLAVFDFSKGGRQPPPYGLNTLRDRKIFGEVAVSIYGH